MKQPWYWQYLLQVTLATHNPCYSSSKFGLLSNFQWMHIYHWVLTMRYPLEHLHTCTHTHTNKHTYITHIHTYIHTYKHINIHTYIHTHKHTYKHTYIQTYIQTYIHIHTYIHTMGVTWPSIGVTKGCYHNPHACNQNLQAWVVNSIIVVKVKG